MCWSPDGRYIAAGGEDDLVSIYGMAERGVVAWGEGHSSWVTQVAFDPWYQSLFTASGLHLFMMLHVQEAQRALAGRPYLKRNTTTTLNIYTHVDACSQLSPYSHSTVSCRFYAGTVIETACIAAKLACACFQPYTVSMCAELHHDGQCPAMSSKP